MNTRSASPADTVPRPVLVWDAPVRVFHWLAVLSFAGAWLTAESERWRLLHVTLGYTLAGLVAFRLVWGLVGTRHARFSNFVRGPAAVAAYLRGLFQRAPHSAAGHNPAGALAIIGLLLLGVAVTGSGWALYNELGGEVLEELHELAANTMLLLVGVHVAGVVLASRLHHQNLVRSMFTGRQLGRPDEAIGNAWRGLAVVMVLAVAGFWAWQWQSAPVALDAGTASATHPPRP
jgi:cytochrome b